MSVLLIAALGIACVLFAILVLRLHPLIALLLGSLFLLVVTPTQTRLQNTLADAVLVVQMSGSGEIACQANLPPGEYRSWATGDTIESANSVTLERISGPSSPVIETPYNIERQRKYAANPETVAKPTPTEDLVWYSGNSLGAALRPGHKLISASAYESALHSRFSRLGAQLGLGFSKTFKKLGIPVTMAAIVGICLLESGAAAKLVSIIMLIFGRHGTTGALTCSGFILGIPVFFDNVFYLLLPLAKAVGRKRPEMFLSAVMAIIVGATMAHSLVPPTPGPLLVAVALNVDVGMLMMGGLIVGSAAAAVGYGYGMICGKWVKFTDQQIAASLAQKDATSSRSGDASSESNPRRTPPLWLAALPIGLPITILAGGNILEHFLKKTASQSTLAHLSAINNPTLVFIATALIAIGILRIYSTAKTVTGAVAKAVSDAGTIVLLTCAGGTFGAALQQLQLADALGSSVGADASAWGLLWVAFGLTTVIRAAQGSATVAMITSAAVVSQMMGADGVVLPYHPIYVALAIGCGSKPLPWMNDSGFWQVAMMTGMTPIQTLKSFSVALTLMGITGFSVTLLGAWLIPMV